jgi:3-oxoacyl-[acyl-carrier protein] reductase
MGARARAARSPSTRSGVLRGNRHGDPPEADFGRQVLAGLPFHRYARPEEVAATIAFLASPAASYMTGGGVRVDGGWNA